MTEQTETAPKPRPLCLVPAETVQALVRRALITVTPEDRERCCGEYRDHDGFCVIRPGHPVWVGLL